MVLGASVGVVFGAVLEAVLNIRVLGIFLERRGRRGRWTRDPKTWGVRCRWDLKNDQDESKETDLDAGFLKGLTTSVGGFREHRRQ